MAFQMMFPEKAFVASLALVPTHLTMAAVRMCIEVSSIEKPFVADVASKLISTGVQLSMFDISGI